MRAAEPDSRPPETTEDMRASPDGMADPPDDRPDMRALDMADEEADLGDVQPADMRPEAEADMEAAPDCLAPGSYERSVVVQGVEHRFTLDVPQVQQPDAALVVQYHGGLSTASAMDLVSGLSALGEQEGFLTLSPEGFDLNPIGQLWNAGSCCGPPSFMVDHIAATEAILDEVATMGACFDPRRVYATGHSNGGIMTYRVACELSDRFAAVAVSAGFIADEDYRQQPPAQVYTCAPERPVPVLHVHGLEDGCILYEGGVSEGRNGQYNPPIEDVIGRWRTMNQCQDGTDQTQGEVRRRRWPCAQDTAVELITVEALGHPWAGSDIYGQAGRERCGGTTSMAVSTTAEAWRFFQEFTLP